MIPKDIVSKHIFEHPAPARGLIIDIISYPDRVALRFYRDNFNSIPDSKQQSMVEWLETVLRDLNHTNDFIVTIEMEASAS